MSTPTNAKRAEKNVLDTVSQKKRRGPHPLVEPSSVRGRADNYRVVLGNVWSRLWPLLSRVETEGDVIAAFQEAYPDDYEFMPHRAPLVLNVLKERTFPKRRTPQINFMADSLAGLGRVTARRSRDICAEERARVRRSHHILRCEFYVECSCSYKGPSHNQACPLCGAVIPQLLASKAFL